jgi:hypothetical protein
VTANTALEAACRHAALLNLRRSIRRIEEKAMTKHSTFTRCAYCGAPFPLVEGHIYSWRVGDHYACNEFCAEAVEDTPPAQQAS